MAKKMKNSFLLLLSLILTACGLAEPTDPFVLEPDTEAPVIIDSKPINQGILDYDEDKIVLTLDEAIDPSTLAALNSLKIMSNTSIQIKGSWRFDESNNTLTFTLDDRTAVPANQEFTLVIDGEVTDTSGNPLSKTLRFRTPALFKLILDEVSGLGNGDTLEITHGISTDATKSTLELNADSKNIKLSEVLKEDDTYTLKISQAAQKRFCTLSQSSIKITNSDASVSVKCHNVLPAHPEASMWNQYFGAAPDPKAHGGELKKVSFQDSHSCDELHAQDALEAFDWTCSKDDATNEITFFSTGLKTDKGLTDLVQFGNSPAWKNNKLSVFNENNSIIYETSEGIWWTNPVMALSVGSTLASEGVVYLLQDGADLTKNLSIIANGVSLVIDPFVDFSPIGTAGVHISNGGNGGSIIATWVEGSIDATSSKSGIKVNNSTLAVLRNVTVKNAYANGIEIIDTKMTQIINSQSASNTGNGVSISTSKQSQIQNFISVNNKLSGVSLSSAEVKIHGLSSSNNNEDGVVITGSSNQLTDAIVSNNRQNGLVIAGAANNIINSVTIASNGEAGVLFKQTANKTVSARNNLLSNMTIANNGANSILFDTSEADTHVNNQFINILDAYNALAAECPASDCNVLKTLSTSDIPLNALFTPVSSDTNIARITSEDTLLRFGIVNQLATFQNKFRAWGDASSGTCNTGEITDCKLFDWRLNATNTDQALTQLGLTDIEPANTHTFLLAPEASSFLNNAIEIYGDGIGNDNSLCETDESCLFTPNIGSYQGHGEILPMEGAGNSLNATLFSYSENGA